MVFSDWDNLAIVAPQHICSLFSIIQHMCYTLHSSSCVNYYLFFQILIILYYLNIIYCYLPSSCIFLTLLMWFWSQVRTKKKGLTVFFPLKSLYLTLEHVFIFLPQSSSDDVGNLRLLNHLSHWSLCGSSHLYLVYLTKARLFYTMQLHLEAVTDDSQLSLDSPHATEEQGFVPTRTLSCEVLHFWLLLTNFAGGFCRHTLLYCSRWSRVCAPGQDPDLCCNFFTL